MKKLEPFMPIIGVIGLLAVWSVAVHGGFDFNFHIPANALYWAFFAGVFWVTPAADRG